MIPKADAKRVLWLKQFAATVDKYAAKYSITADEAKDENMSNSNDVMSVTVTGV